MPKGFFSSSQKFTQPKILNRVLRCGACGLSKDADSVNVKPSGGFAKKILIIVDSPGGGSVRSMVLSGKTGFKIRRTFNQYGIDIAEDCLVTSSVRCQPDDRKDINPNTAQHCQPALFTLIKERKPRAIITVGTLASTSLIETAWNHSHGGLDRWAGFTIPSQEWNCWICPTYDPRLLLIKKHKVMDMRFQEHIQQAIVLAKKRPWEKVPEYIKQVRIVLDPKKAASIIRRNLKKGRNFASFDYETNRIKPDKENRRLVSMSICFDGEETIAFPWVGEAIKGAVEFLKSPIKKIAANMKFEDRWTRAVLGFPVRRFVWDTMVVEHIMDGRPGICGLKFQSFAYLGMPSYDNHIMPLLRSNNPDGTNRIDEIDIKDLLLYNGLDSILTFDIAMKQMKYLGKG